MHACVTGKGVGQSSDSRKSKTIPAEAQVAQGQRLALLSRIRRRALRLARHPHGCRERRGPLVPEPIHAYVCVCVREREFMDTNTV